MNFENFIKENYYNYFIHNMYIIGKNWFILKPFNKEQIEYSKKMLYHIPERECTLCHTNFNYGQSRKIICDCCKIFTVCKGCNKIMKINLENYSGTKRKLIIDNIINNKEIIVTHGYSCSNLSRYNYGKCPNCGKENVKIYNNRCSFCANKELNKEIICPIHGKQNVSFAGKCIICHNQTDSMRKQAGELGKITGPINVKIMNESNKKYFEKTGMYPFQEEMIRQIKNGERDKWPGCVGFPNFIIENNIEFIFDHSINKYVEKEIFFKSFEKRIKHEDINTEINKFINLGFNMEPIIKINDQNWNRAETDKYLSDKGYKWIVYIKLFLNKPFIIGKTGTSLVNNSGIDFDFKVYDENDVKNYHYSGQGRRFIREYYPNIKYTDFDKILVKKFNAESEALENEQIIGKKYGLFFS